MQHCDHNQANSIYQMASSIITVFRWSIFRVSSIAVIFLWIFNPLGSQASFRGAYLRPATGASQGNISYYSPDLSVQLDLCPFVGGSTPAIRALYSTSLYDNAARTQYVDVSQGVAKNVVTMMGGESSIATLGAMDTWGNVRIPALQYVDGYDSDRPHRWLKTPWDEKIQNYSSLLGERVAGLNLKSVGNTTFTLESSFQSFKVSLKTTTPNAMVNSNNIHSVFHGSGSTTLHHQRTKQPAETSRMQIFGSYKTQASHIVVTSAQTTLAAPPSTAHFS
jgi:hypothetical protein